MMTTLRLMAGTIVLLVATVQQTKAQMPTAPLTGQDLVWATVAFHTVAGSFVNRGRALSPAILQVSMMDDAAAKRRAQKAILQEMPDLDKLKAWGEALQKQVSQNKVDPIVKTIFCPQ